MEPEVSGKMWRPHANLSQTLIPKPPLSKKVPFLTNCGSLQDISNSKILSKSKDPNTPEDLILASKTLLKMADEGL